MCGEKLSTVVIVNVQLTILQIARGIFCFWQQHNILILVYLFNYKVKSQTPLIKPPVQSTGWWEAHSKHIPFVSFQTQLAVKWKEHASFK